LNVKLQKPEPAVYPGQRQTQLPPREFDNLGNKCSGIDKYLNADSTIKPEYVHMIDFFTKNCGDDGTRLGELKKMTSSHTHTHKQQK
jgi:hypothetical protein